jgi:hypothetical protein
MKKEYNGSSSRDQVDDTSSDHGDIVVGVIRIPSRKLLPGTRNSEITAECDIMCNCYNTVTREQYGTASGAAARQPARPRQIAAR